MAKSKTVNPFDVTADLDQLPDPPSKYLRMREPGKCRLHILNPPKPVRGFEWWTDAKDGKRQPNRARTILEIPERVKRSTGDDRPSEFWAFAVWNYTDKALQVYEPTQKSILIALRRIAEDWGDPAKFDLTLSREGTTRDTTRWTVNAVPTDEKHIVPDAAIQAANAINLEALFSGDDPFADPACIPDPEAMQSDLIPF